MNFRRHGILLQLTLALCFHPPDSRAATAVHLIDSFVKEGAARTNYGGALGVQFVFAGATGGKVTELGIYDGNNPPGLRIAHLLSLYAVDWEGAITGTLLASTTIAAGASAGQPNAFVYAPLATPVPLTNGALYVVVADYPTQHSVDPFFNVAPGQVSSEIGRQIASRFSDSTGHPNQFVPANGFPNVFSPPLAAYAGPNLRLEPVPERPSFPTEPESRVAYETHSVQLGAAVRGSPPLTLQWQGRSLDGPWTNLIASGNVLGVQSNTLTLSNLTLADAGEYILLAANNLSVSTSRVVSVSVAPVPPAVTNRHAFAEAIMSHRPLAYWRLNDAAGSPLLFDSAGSFDARPVQLSLGVGGLRPPAFPGFSAANTAGYFDGFSSALVSGRSLANGLSEFTLTAWISPSGPNPSLRTGLLGQNDALELGYNDSEGLILWFPMGPNWFKLTTGTNGFAWDQWYFVAVSARENIVSIHVNGVPRAQQGGTPSGSSTYSFNAGGGGILDPAGNFFNGRIEDVAIIPRGLAPQEIQRLYGVAVGFFSPAIFSQPASHTVLAGKTTSFRVGAEGGELAYQWQKWHLPLRSSESGESGEYIDLVEGGGLAGVRSQELAFNAARPEEAGTYRVVISNRAGTVTSEAVQLTVLPAAAPNSFAEGVLSLSPVAYWRFDETVDPASGTARAYDSARQFHGEYGATVRNGHPSYDVAGPRPTDGLKFFEPTNRAIQIVPGVSNGWVSVPPLHLKTNQMSIIAWLKPSGPVDDYAGIFVSRGWDEEVFALGYGGTATINAGMVNYTWTTSKSTWDWITNVRPATNQWSFVALSVTNDQAWIYHNGKAIAINAGLEDVHIPLRFDLTATIGTDLLLPLNRMFNGAIDEVAIFDFFLTERQVKALYEGGGRLQARLSLAPSAGGGWSLSWDRPGTLQYASALEGIRTLWTDLGTNSPAAIANEANARFFRVIVE